MFRFSDPQYLAAVILVFFLAYHHFMLKGTSGASIRFSDIGFAKAAARPGAARVTHILFLVRLLALICLIGALARPQSGVQGEEVITEGVDIILVMDVSGSMLAEDIKPNRVTAAKEVAASFIRGRKNDRIGMVVFAGEAYTQCPLTLDYGILLRRHSHRNGPGYRGQQTAA
jgi:Ca-activated chloride channel family protein